MKLLMLLATGLSLLLAGPTIYAQTSTTSTSTTPTTTTQHTTTHSTKYHKRHTTSQPHAGSAAAQPRTRTVCEDVVVQDTPKDSNQIAGMAIGAVAGGLLGHQVGGGKGKTLATVAGAVGGGYAGKKVQEHQQAKNTHTEQRCHEVTN
jgi:uncharacterized protein YcfJ